MRQNGYINDLFLRGGPFIGKDRPNMVVTVERDFFLNEANVAGKYFANSTKNDVHKKHRNPVRWFQSKDNMQIETPIPNVSRISIDRDVKQDAAGCNITLVNNKMKSNTAELSLAAAYGHTLGDPGYYTYNRGHVKAGRDRWRYTTNEWHRVIQPGALLRTYEGYGGHDKTLDECLVDGNLMQTGAWIVDAVDIGADGKMGIKCRDTAALLIDQIMYPPLMPNACYPTQFMSKDAPFWTWKGKPVYNYDDISSIVSLICLWAGFWLKDDKMLPRIFGNIEQTGFAPDSPIGPDFFDKRTCIDVINELKDIVGYITWVDQEGAFHFESKNLWEKGNFIYTGQHVDTIFDLDEKTNLLEYGITVNKAADRSDIYVASSNPQLNLPGAKYVRHKWLPAKPGEAAGTFLRGMSVPMIMSVKVDMPLDKMTIMAQLIHLYLWFSRRQGNATVPGNPCIDINDQVRIWERTTSDNFYHYVNGVRSDNDLITGVYTMTLDTNWLGTAENWAIVEDTEWSLKYSVDDTVSVSPDSYAPYRKGKMVGRKGS